MPSYGHPTFLLLHRRRWNGATPWAPSSLIQDGFPSSQHWAQLSIVIGTLQDSLPSSQHWAQLSIVVGTFIGLTYSGVSLGEEAAIVTCVAANQARGHQICPAWLQRAATAWGRTGVSFGGRVAASSGRVGARTGCGWPSQILSARAQPVPANGTGGTLVPDQTSRAQGTFGLASEGSGIQSPPRQYTARSTGQRRCLRLPGSYQPKGENRDQTWRDGI